jgi:hypothetical protein
MIKRPMPYKELVIVTSSKSANMYECSFINQICSSITIVNFQKKYLEMAESNRNKENELRSKFTIAD